MATSSPAHAFLQYLGDFNHEDFDDRESIASNETDDGQEHAPEKIIAELQAKRNSFVWYLVKWENCPVLRSSWEGVGFFDNYPWMLDEWIVEKQKQLEGKSKPLDIAAFNEAVLEVELAERQRRILRRLKRQVTRVLSIVSD